MKRRKSEVEVDDWLMMVTVRNPDPAGFRDQLTSGQLWALEARCPPLVKKWWEKTLYPRITQHFVLQLSHIPSPLFQIKDLGCLIVDYWQGLPRQTGWTNHAEPSCFCWPNYWHFGDAHPLSPDIVQLLKTEPDLWEMTPETITIWPDRFYENGKLRQSEISKDDNDDDDGVMDWKIGGGEISFHPNTNARPHPHIIALELDLY